MELWTDGSAGPTNPGPGGWAVVTRTEPLAYGYQPWTTNVQMEGSAIFYALGYLRGGQGTIYTDSQLWVHTLKKWAPKWAQNGWTKSNGQPVKNLEMVQAALSAFQQSKANLVWIRGHGNNQGNILADEWAGKARIERISRG